MDTISTIFLAVSLMIIMFGMGLSLVLEDFKRVFVFPKAVFVGLINQLLLLPLVAFTLAVSFDLPSEIAIGLMLLAACPGGATSNLFSHLAKGNVALSVTLTALSSFITIITIPIIVNFALIYFTKEGQVITLDIPKTIAQIFIITIIPVCTGMIIRHYKEAFALRMDKPVRIFSAIIIVVVILALVLKDKENFVTYFKEAGLVSFLLNVGTMLLGYFSAKLFSIKDENAVSISIESGIQNGTLAIAIAVGVLGNASLAIAPAVYSLIMFFSGAFMVYLFGRNKAK